MELSRGASPACVILSGSSLLVHPPLPWRMPHGLLYLQYSSPQ